MTVEPVDYRSLAQLVGERLGLHFPEGRLPELKRGIASAATELGFVDADAWARELLVASRVDSRLELVANHLTIGETYFFRGDETFAALAGHVLPALIEARRCGGKRLRIWSAACCTGEEAYSLAILLRQAVPDIDDWHVTLLATDINTRFLARAAEGVYGGWSFRGTSPSLRERWFSRCGDNHYEVAPEIRRMVQFAPLNLVDGSHCPAVDVGDMDLVLCRNVLMYFMPAQAGRAVAKLRRSLRADGWLAVAPCEVSPTLFAGFAPVMHEGAILYQQSSAASPPVAAAHPTAGDFVPVRPRTVRPEAGPRHGAKPAIARLRPVPGSSPAGSRAPTAHAPKSRVTDPSVLARRAHSLANQGCLVEALHCCDHWIAADKMDAHAHSLRAMVLIELGDGTQARHSLQRSLYLAPGVAMTSFAAGDLERALGSPLAATQHYRNTLELLDCAPPDAALPGTGGVTAGQLRALVRDRLHP